MQNVIQLNNLEARKLLQKNGVNHNKLSEAYLNLVTETIDLIKARHCGAFNETHILPIINFLDIHWTPSAISIALDPAYSE